MRATELVREAKDTGQDIDELLAQAGLFGDNALEAEALARFIATNNRSAKRMTAAFKAMGDIFEGGQVTLIDILGRISQELESDGVQTGFMFESMSKVDKQAEYL